MQVMMSYVTEIEQTFKYVYFYDLRLDSNKRARQVFLDAVRSQPDHMNAEPYTETFWKNIMKRVPQPWKKMVFDPARKQAEKHARAYNMAKDAVKVYAEGDNVSVLSYVKEIVGKLHEEMQTVTEKFITAYRLTYQSHQSRSHHNNIEHAYLLEDDRQLQVDELSPSKMYEEEWQRQEQASEMAAEYLSKQVEQSSSNEHFASIEKAPSPASGGSLVDKPFDKLLGSPRRAEPNRTSPNPRRLYDPTNDSRQVCYRYARQGAKGCDKGSSCKFSHDKKKCEEFLKTDMKYQQQRDGLASIFENKDSPYIQSVCHELGGDFRDIWEFVQSKQTE